MSRKAFRSWFGESADCAAGSVPASTGQSIHRIRVSPFGICPQCTHHRGRSRTPIAVIADDILVVMEDNNADNADNGSSGNASGKAAGDGSSGRKSGGGFDVFSFTEDIDWLVRLLVCIGIGVIAGIISFAVAVNPPAAWNQLSSFVAMHMKTMRVLAGVFALFATVYIAAVMPWMIIYSARRLSHGMLGGMLTVVLPMLMVFALPALLAWFAIGSPWVQVPYAVCWLAFAVLSVVSASRKASAADRKTGDSACQQE